MKYLKRHKKIHLKIVLSVFVSLFLCFTGIANAVYMPNYEIVQSVTENLSAPAAVALDISDNLYVLESAYGKLHIYDQNGNFAVTYSGLGEPVSIAVESGGNILIGIKGTGSVNVYDAGMNLVDQLGSGDGEFTHPNAIAIDSSSGLIYVSDGLEDRINIYNSDYSFNSSFGSTGNGNGEFNYPNGIAIDGIASELIVTDLRVLTSGPNFHETARVQVFDLSGNFIRTFGEFGVGNGYLFRPAGVMVDSQSRIYVSDAYQNLVQVFDDAGDYIGTLTDMDSPMRTPVGMALTAGNKLFVASLNAARVDTYSLSEPPADPQIEIDPDTYDFGDVTEGYTSLEQSFTVSNTGLADLVIDTVSITGEFSIVVDNCLAQTLEYLEECTVDVVFSPLTEGAKSGDLTVRDVNYPTVPEAAASLSGNGIDSGANQAPAADAGGPYSGTEGQTILLDGSASSDADGTIDLYEWDIDDDGTYEYISASPTRYHTYSQQGTYNIRLRVRDNLGATDEAVTTADIADTVPAVDFTGVPTSGSAPLTVDFFNGSTGYDQPLTYEWDFDNDGNVDSGDVNPQYIYTSAGGYTVKLTVTDNDSSTNSLTRTLYINVTAGGCSFPPVKIGGTYYYTLQDAYNNVNDGSTIKSQDEIFIGDLSLDRDISVSLAGGYDCNFSNITGGTVINGMVTISSGTITISNGTITIGE